MVKRAICLVLCVALALAAGGCWNYRGLNQMSMVMGLAIDMDEQTGNYLVTYEVFQPVGKDQKSDEQSHLIEGEGKTIFDAARNAKRRSLDKLYFGSAGLLIISQGIAKQGNILRVFEWFLSDAECRETICLAVAQTNKASEILKARGEGNEIISSVVQDIIMEDNKTTSSMPHTQLYKAYNLLKAKGIMLTLPAVHTTLNDDKIFPELNGTAVFQKEKLVGFLTPEESKYYLIACNMAEGAILTIPSSGADKDYLSLEMSSSSSDVSFSCEGDMPVFEVKTTTEVFVGEKGISDAPFKEADILRIESTAGEVIKSNIEKVISKAQKEYRSDIFGFGSRIHKYDLKLWERVGEHWDELFPSITVKVSSEVHVLNTAFIK